MRVGTWLLIAAVCGLGLAAAVDALRDEERSSPRPAVDETATPRSEAARVAEALREEGIRGLLTYSDERCRLHAVELPELEARPAASERSCEFSGSPRNVFSVGGTVRDPRGSRTASCADGSVELRTRYGVVLARGHACAPAWKPNGVLTAVRDGELVELRVLGESRRLAARVLVSREDFARALGRDPWALRSPALAEVVWLDDDTFAGILVDRRRGERVIALFRRGRFVAAPPSPYDELSHLRASPFGKYVAARLGRGGLVVLDDEGRYLSLGFRAARAIAWSPDETWTAVATSDGVYVFPTGERPIGLVRLPFRAFDLFWQ